LHPIIGSGLPDRKMRNTGPINRLLTFRTMAARPQDDRLIPDDACVDRYARRVGRRRRAKPRLGYRSAQTPAGIMARFAPHFSISPDRKLSNAELAHVRQLHERFAQGQAGGARACLIFFDQSCSFT
jgi:hypothetical protein